MGYLHAARILLSVVTLFLGAEMASAQSRSRDCFIDRHGRRVCDHRPEPPPHHRPPPNHPPHYPPYQPPYNPPYEPPHYPPVDPGFAYELQEFRRNEQEAIYFDDLYRRAPVNSWEERRAQEDRDEAIRRALASIQGYGALDRLRADEVIEFAREMNRKYQAARVNSAMERLYLEAVGIAFQALETTELREAQYARDFREVESKVLFYLDIYKAAPVNSREERVALNIFNALSRAAVAKLDEQRRYMDPRELNSIAYEYDDRYRRARAGSLEERYYREVRDVAGRRY